MGSNENARGGRVYAVKRILRHENFDPQTIDWDYALVELEQNIEFSEDVQPIRLIGIQQVVQDDTVALVTGMFSWASFLSSQGGHFTEHFQQAGERRYHQNRIAYCMGLRFRL